MKKEKTIDAKAAINDVFGSAPVQAKAPKKGKAAEKEEIEFSSDFETLVNVTIVEKALEGVKKSLKSQYDEFVFEIFQAKVNETGKKPASIAAIYGEASANYRLQNPGHGFSADTAQELDAHGINYDVEEKEGEQFIINPEILANQELLGKLAVALKGLKGFEDMQIIQKTETLKKCTPNEATFEGIAKLEPSEQKKLLKEVGTLYFVDQKLSGGDHKDQSIVNRALNNLANAGVLKWTPEKKTK